MASSTLLTAKWRKLAVANSAVDPDLFTSYLPAGTELDLWQDTCYMSLVGFMFLNPVEGIADTLSYGFRGSESSFFMSCIRMQEFGERGVVNIKEIVPKPAITLVATEFIKRTIKRRKCAIAGSFLQMASR